LKNYKAQKHSRDEQIGGHVSDAKKVKVNEKVDGELKVDEIADVAVKEGTAISVLFYLSVL
jgi:hypothetical protein